MAGLTSFRVRAACMSFSSPTAVHRHSVTVHSSLSTKSVAIEICHINVLPGTTVSSGKHCASLQPKRYAFVCRNVAPGSSESSSSLIIVLASLCLLTFKSSPAPKDLLPLLDSRYPLAVSSVHLPLYAPPCPRS
jgi:hypothetical protein